jgi:YebC/PmpR family DNA-binding regulatory protein
MSGHSHAANIKHKKAAADAKKGKVFSRWAKAIMVAARAGGGDPEANLALKYAVEKARASNMPRDTIERAIKKGTGELEGEALVELSYEGFAAGGVAVFVECLTDNKNRTSPEIRKIFESRGARVGAPGSVSWMFEKRGVIAVPQSAIGEEEIMTLALEAGADDMQVLDGSYEVLTSPDGFEAVQKAVDGRGLKPEVAEVLLLPKNKVEVTDPKVARKVLDLVEALEDHEDVQNVVTNQEISDEVLGAARAE